jgi:hypothetical protein
MESHFGDLFDGFLASYASRSHFLRDVTTGFIEYVHAQLESAGHPASPIFPTYVLELAELEATRIVVAAAREQRSENKLELDLELGLAFSEASRVLSFEHAVHKLPDNEDDRSIPQARPTHILSYRSEENAVRYLELSLVAATVIDGLMNGRALGPAIKQACNKVDQPLTDEVLAGTAQLLADLAERGVITGVAAQEG